RRGGVGQEQLTGASGGSLTPTLSRKRERETRSRRDQQVEDSGRSSSGDCIQQRRAEIIHACIIDLQDHSRRQTSYCCHAQERNEAAVRSPSPACGRGSG